MRGQRNRLISQSAANTRDRFLDFPGRSAHPTFGEDWSYQRMRLGILPCLLSRKVDIIWSVRPVCLTDHA
jgi:hypothetical protein